MKSQETSYPRDKIKILLLENISASAIGAFEGGGYVGIRKIPGALGEKELCPGSATPEKFNASLR